MRQKQIAAMTKGDKIITMGGLVAIVSDVKDDVVVAKIGNEVKVEIMKNSVQQVMSK
jgi:preprotein translocase YajC subunit